MNAFFRNSQAAVYALSPSLSSSPSSSTAPLAAAPFRRPLRRVAATTATVLAASAFTPSSRGASSSFFASAAAAAAAVPPSIPSSFAIRSFSSSSFLIPDPKEVRPPASLSSPPPRSFTRGLKTSLPPRFPLRYLRGGCGGDDRRPRSSSLRAMSSASSKSATGGSANDGDSGATGGASVASPPVVIDGAPGSLRRLCTVALRACEVMNPLISAFYDAVNDGDGGNDADAVATKKKKRDESAFTIADGTVQRLLVEELFGRVPFRDVVGEEDSGGGAASSEEEEANASWYRVEGLTVPHDLRPLLDDARREVRRLAREYLPPPASDASRRYDNLTVFVDPIDGTREFSTGKGEQCTVCIGISRRGRPVAGVVYRPLSSPRPTWASGAALEGYADSRLLDDGGADRDDDGTAAAAGDRPATGLLTTNGSISPFLEALTDELDCPRIRSGGAGNKMLILLERPGTAYVQDRGLSRWDTCAAEACLDAHGGRLTKLTSFLEGGDDDNNDDDDGRSPSYTYLAGERNADFAPGLANLTPYNCSPASGFRKGDPARRVTDSLEVKPYANLCGLVALGRDTNAGVSRRALRDAAARASRRSAPSYD